MKKTVYVIYTINKEDSRDSMIFGTNERAKKWLENWKKDEHKVFKNSTKDELFICRRIVF